MTQPARANRQGYATEVFQCKNAYMRRAHPAEPVETVYTISPEQKERLLDLLINGDSRCLVFALTDKQHEGFCRDAHDLWFKKSVLA